MLRGASAEAQAELTSELEGSKGDADKLAEELFGVAAVLRGEPAVRRILTDASVEPDAKASLAGDVFGNALGETATGAGQVGREAPLDRLARPRRRDRGARRPRRSQVRGRRRQQDQRRALRGPSGRRQDARACVRPSRTRRDRRRTRASCCAPCSAGSCCPPRCCWSSRRPPVGTAPSTAPSRCSSTPRRTASARRSRPCTPPGSSPTTSAAGWPRRSARSTTPTIHLLVVQDPEIVGGLRVEIGDDVIDGTVASKLEDAQTKARRLTTPCRA